jgi:hypothetical protein
MFNFVVDNLNPLRYNVSKRRTIMIKNTCKLCKKTFWIKPYRKNVSLYCSHKCYAISKIGHTPWNKGKKGLVTMSEATKKKMSASAKGKNTWSKGRKETEEHKQNISKALKQKYVGPNRWNYKTGRIKTTNGYVAVINPERFNGDKRRYIKEHVFIMESYLGRRLNPAKEVVHHINGNIVDNSLENLIVMKRNQHQKLHNSYENHRKIWSRVRPLGPKATHQKALLRNMRDTSK